MTKASSPPRRSAGAGQRYDLGPMAPVDEVLIEARHVRARRLDGMLRAGGRRFWHILVSLVAPAFGWNRRAAIVPREREKPLMGYLGRLGTHNGTARAEQ